VLGRIAFDRDERSVGQFLEAVEPEFADFLHRRIRERPQIVLVAGKAVVIKTVLQKPRARGVNPPPRRSAKGPGCSAKRPAARTAKIFLRIFRAHRANRLDPCGKRLETLPDVRDIGHPVVHLNVHVGVIIAIPWRLVAIVPYALQIRRKPSFTRRRDQEIASELEEQRFKP